jgi:2-phosphosulfolactate phosphatase
MKTEIEVMFTPAEFARLPERDLRNTVCVVFDVLRATSTMLTALAHGAIEILPVSTVAEALAVRRLRPEVLLAGERQGHRILASLSGGPDFDLGNSPREFTREKVQGRSVVMTTTNGTRAIHACRGAAVTLLGAFLNLEVVAHWLRQHPQLNCLLICSGTYEEAAYEDVLAAGALGDELWDLWGCRAIADSTAMARALFQHAAGNLTEARLASRNARRLRSIPELAEDVDYCFQVNSLPLLAQVDPAGAVRLIA